MRSSYLLPALAAAALATKTTIIHGDTLVTVDADAGTFDCDTVLDTYDQAREECNEIGCSSGDEFCDDNDNICVSIDGTLNSDVPDKFHNILDELRKVIEGACKEEDTDDNVCIPGGVCSPQPSKRTTVPSNIGVATSYNDGRFVGNYKIHFSKNEGGSECDVIADAINAGIGLLPSPAGSLLGSLDLDCDA